MAQSFLRLLIQFAGIAELHSGKLSRCVICLFMMLVTSFPRCAPRPHPAWPLFRFVWLDQRQSVEQNFAIAFNVESRLRALIVKLFTGAYRGIVDDVNVPRVPFALGK